MITGTDFTFVRPSADLGLADGRTNDLRVASDFGDATNIAHQLRGIRKLHGLVMSDDPEFSNSLAPGYAAFLSRYPISLPKMNQTSVERPSDHNYAHRSHSKPGSLFILSQR